MVCAYKLKYQLHTSSKCPTLEFTCRWIKNHEETGNSGRKPRKNTESSSKSPQMCEAVGMIVKKNPSILQRHIAAVARTRKSNIQRILKLYLKLQPYKFQMLQALQPKDYEKQQQFARFTNMRNIIFSDEAHFLDHLDGVINKQDYRFYRETNPQMMLDTSLHPKKALFGLVWRHVVSMALSSSRTPAAKRQPSSKKCCEETCHITRCYYSPKK